MAVVPQAFRSPLSDDLEQRIVAGVDREELVADVASLIAFESWGGSEVAIQNEMADRYLAAGLDVDRWEIDVDALSRHPAYGAEIERERAVGVVGRRGEGDGPTLILNGHVDVVPAGEGWSVAPFRGTRRSVDGEDRLYGRGSCDMKGGVVCALQAVRALQRAGVTLKGTLLLHAVVGEEDGGLGTLATIERGHTGDAAVILEPTELTVVPAQGGALSFRIVLEGRAAHGALRTEGVNPIGKVGRIWRALEALEARRMVQLRHPLFDEWDVAFPLSPGTVRAGIWPSSVPDTLVLEGRYGVGIGESFDDARADFEAAVADAARGDRWLEAHPPRVEWWGARFAPAAIDPDHPLVAATAAACRDATGTLPRLRGMPYGADMHLLVNQGGTPTVMFGPGDIRRAHAADEFVPVDDLVAAARTVALLAARFCGVADGR